MFPLKLPGPKRPSLNTTLMQGITPISVITLVNLTMFRIPIEACFRPPRLFHLSSNLHQKYHTRILKLAVSYPFVKVHTSPT